jgi:pimeloyl-ACP methyl ester carboxylesterase
MHATSTAARHLAVEIPVGFHSLPGDLLIPDRPVGIVAFAHGSGSSRLSPRNQAVATALHEARLATLLFDLLTETEARDRGNVFNIPLLGERLVSAIDWLGTRSETRALPIGTFGASTGAAAALAAAALRADSVAAVVSRGGRPDLAAPWLGGVRAPTLLIVGSLDHAVLGLNQSALEQLSCPKQLVLVRGATHLFEEPGTLEEVERLARGWFARYLAAG